MLTGIRFEGGSPLTVELACLLRFGKQRLQQVWGVLGSRGASPSPTTIPTVGLAQGAGEAEGGTG